ncbi:MAG: hypothetical protein IIA50_04030 [Bacteroidetes bacterium]|nr:hypothetical protein [Bacteroidota bacterium]
MKKLFSLLMGLVAGVIVIILIQLISHLVFTMPEGLEVTHYGQWGRYLDQMPKSAIAAILLGWFGGAYVASYIATRSSKDISLLSAAMEGLLFTGGGVMILSAASYPAWMWIVGIASIVLGSLLGGQKAISATFN